MELLTDTALATLKQSRGKVALCFSGAHCPHCHTYVPVFKHSAETRSDWQFFLVDTADAPALCDAFGVRAIPLTVLVRDGKECARHAGTLSPGALAQFLAQSE